MFLLLAKKLHTNPENAALYAALNLASELPIVTGL